MPAMDQRNVPEKRSFLRLLLINTFAASLAPVFDWVSSGELNWRRAQTEFEISFVFAQCIGTLLWLAAPHLWPLLNSLPSFPRWGIRFLVVSVLCALGTLLAGVIIPHLNLDIHEEFWSFFKKNVKVSIFLGVAISFAIGSFETMRHRLEATQLQLRTHELERERAMKQATEARLASLESRIHPHFLFNTINSISSLIPEDPDRAERLLERMSALLRFSLDSQQNRIVSLEREMKIVADYLEIEQTRFGDRLRYDVTFNPAIGGLGVPPLSIQTLAENSVKYAVAPRRQGGVISVRAQREDHQLVIEVWDDGEPFSLNSIPSAHGLDNLQARLATLFPEKAWLDVRHDELGKAVRIVLPAETAVKRTA